MNQTSLPSIWRIIEIDYTSLVAALAPPVAWALYLFTSYLGRSGGETFYLMIALGATAIGLIVLGLRVLSIRSLFSDGVTVPGQVEQVWFYRDRGRVIFTYTYMGEEYHTGSAIHKNQRTLALQPGDPVTIVVDQGNPKRAMVQDLFV